MRDDHAHCKACLPYLCPFVPQIAALLDALEDYEGAIVVISHDRPFCEAVRCTHVAYVSSGKITLEERSLRDSDFTVSDRGVVNVATGSVLSETNQEAVDKVRAENKVTAKLDRAQQKARGSAPRKIKTIEKKVRVGAPFPSSLRDSHFLDIQGAGLM